MNEDELIIKQALEIEELKEMIDDYREITRLINNQLTSVGAPLNDNILGYSKEQLSTFRDIQKYVDSMSEDWVKNLS